MPSEIRVRNRVSVLSLFPYRPGKFSLFPLPSKVFQGPIQLQPALLVFASLWEMFSAVNVSSVAFCDLCNTPQLLSRAGRLDLACHLVAREMREMHGVPPTRMVRSAHVRVPQLT